MSLMCALFYSTDSTSPLCYKALFCSGIETLKKSVLVTVQGDIKKKKCSRLPGKLNLGKNNKIGYIWLFKY